MKSIVKQVGQAIKAKTNEEKEKDNDISLDESYSTKQATKFSNTIIKLNVGGQRFITTSDTLAKYPNSYFHGLLSKKFGHQMVDKDYLFIDRNGKLFEYILEYLRSGYVEIPENKCNQISNELDFYSLPLKVTYIPPKYHNVEILEHNFYHYSNSRDYKSDVSNRRFSIQCINKHEHLAFGLMEEDFGVIVPCCSDQYIKNKKGDKINTPEQAIEYFVKQFDFRLRQTPQQNPVCCMQDTQQKQMLQKVHILSPSPNHTGKWCLAAK